MLITRLFQTFVKDNILTTEQAVLNIFSGKKASVFGGKKEDHRKSFFKIDKSMSFAKLLTQNISLGKKLSKGTNDFFNKNRVNEIKILGNGTAFGELALLTNKPRAASIICKTDTHFAILEKEYFDKILKINEQKKLFGQIEFLEKIKLFDSLSFNALRNLYYNSENKEFNINNVIYKQGDKAQNFYLIKSGEFKVIFLNQR